MRLQSLSLRQDTHSKVNDYRSTVEIASLAVPGVRFTIARMSFGRRLELGTRIRELSKRVEFHQGGQETGEKIEAGILVCEIDRVYLQWGLVHISGLSIDGEPATVESVLERGPDGLSREIVAAIKAQCGLTEDERKN